MMYVLLSSHYRPRYKEDILRCLAAPQGAVIQFRYDRKYISQSVRDSLEKICGRALVCYVDNDASGILPMVPVREVEIISVTPHGSTVSIQLKTGAFAYAEKIDSFTEEITKMSGGSNPKSIEGNQSGCFLFTISGAPNTLTMAATIEQWEKTVAIISSKQAFACYRYYWTILGLAAAGSTVDARADRDWPILIDRDKIYDLLIYHYHPKLEPSDEVRDELCVGLGNGLTPVDHQVIPIDSRYDLKRWRFKTNPQTFGSENSSIRVGPCGEWSIDLRIAIKGDVLWRLSIGCLSGLLAAMPAVIALYGSSVATNRAIQAGIAVPIAIPWILFIAQVVIGIAAGIIAAFNIKRSI